MTSLGVKAADSPHGQILIINQVRGEECCDPGSLLHLEQQLQTQTELGLPAQYAVRYDALSDEAYVSLLNEYQASFPDLVELGILLEVTPSLAADAGVVYEGDEDSWFEAHHIFTIGYHQDARKQIVDEVVEKFQTTFETPPRFTTAWIIDTPTLNYLNQEHGFQFHQITREQWGTDSYHLYGGPPHYPYPASKNWAFIPDYSFKDNTIILRQTLTDPRYNYGDSTNSFTSQPNDYRLGSRDLEYFKQLVTQAQTQPGEQLGFSLIGLENSMPKEDQDEFQRQLEWVKEFSSQTQVEVVRLDELTTWLEKSNTVYASNEGDQDVAWWITTSKYRARVIKQGVNVMMTDFRVFNKQWLDPYTEYEAQNRGYWIVPALLDASLWHPDLEEKGFLESIFELPSPGKTYTPANDFAAEFKTHLVVTQTGGQPYFDGKNLVIDKDLGSKISFEEDKLVFYKLKPRLHGRVLDEYPIELKINGEMVHSTEDNLLSGDLSCVDESCKLTFSSQYPQDYNQFQQHYPFIFPEQKPRPLDIEASILYVHNRYAIAGRNPVRVVFYPIDQRGYVTALERPVEISTDTELTQPADASSTRLDEIQFFDFGNDQPTKVKVSFSVGEKTWDETIYFAPDCRRAMIECLTHPSLAWWYLRAVGGDWVRATVE